LAVDVKSAARLPFKHIPYHNYKNRHFFSKIYSEHFERFQTHSVRYLAHIGATLKTATIQFSLVQALMPLAFLKPLPARGEPAAEKQEGFRHKKAALIRRTEGQFENDPSDWTVLKLLRPPVENQPPKNRKDLAKKNCPYPKNGKGSLRMI
jgi:hypothetical protein